MPLPTVDGVPATRFWPGSISDGWVFGSAVVDSPDRKSHDFASYRYRISTGEYERLPAELGPAVLGAENGWVLGVDAGAPVVVAGSLVVRLPQLDGLKEYVVSSLSADGKVGSGYTTDTNSADGVANRPVRWTCR